MSNIENGQRDLAEGRLGCMKVATGRVVGGKVVVDGAALAEGACVTVLVPESDDHFELDPEQEAELLRSLAEADRGELVATDQFLKDLRKRTT